jgi:hypothetical protein
MHVNFTYKGREIEITDDPSSNYKLPFKIIIDGQDRTGVWYLYDDGDDMKPEEFAIRLIDMEALLKATSRLRRGLKLISTRKHAQG